MQRRLKVASININGLLSKKNEIHVLANAFNYDVLCLQETKVDGYISDAELLIPGYSLFRRDRKRGGGGVAIYALSDLHPVPLHLPSDPLLELIDCDPGVWRSSSLQHLLDLHAAKFR